MSISSVIMKSLFFAELSQDVRKSFEDNMRELHFNRGATIYEAGDQPTGIYYVVSGLISIVIAGPSGSEHLTRFFKPGEFFGHRSLLSEEVYHARASVLSKSVVQFIPAREINSAMDTSPQFARLIVKKLASELRFAELHQFDLTENEVIVRVAQAVQYLKEIDSQYSWTRQEIACFCVSTVSTVIKALAHLEQLGLLKQEGRDIQIINESLMNGFVVRKMSLDNLTTDDSIHR